MNFILFHKIVLNDFFIFKMQDNTKIVDVHVFDDFVQKKINKKYKKFDFNGDFELEFKKWVKFLSNVLNEKNIDDKKIKKIFEMLNQLYIYKDIVYVPNTNTKIATLFQKIMYHLENFYKKDNDKFDTLFGYFIEFYSEPESTHCPEGVSNRAYFILELSKDHLNI